MKLKFLLISLVVVLFILGSGKIWAVSEESTSSVKAKDEILNRAAQIATGSAQLAQGQYLGTIETLGKQIITVKTEIGTRNIVTNSETKFVQSSPKKSLVKFTNLKIGGRIIALGSIDASEMLTARVIIIAAPKSPLSNQVVYGIITNLDKTKKVITLKNPRTSLTSTVGISKSTNLKISAKGGPASGGKGEPNPVFGDLEIGFQVAAVGSVDNDGIIQATVVFALPSKTTANEKPASPSALPKK